MSSDSSQSEENLDNDSKKSLHRLSEAFLKVIDYHVLEYKFTYDEIVGCLEMTKLNMWAEYNRLNPIIDEQEE